LHSDSSPAKVSGPDSYRDCQDAASGNIPSRQAGSIAIPT